MIYTHAEHVIAEVGNLFITIQKDKVSLDRITMIPTTVELNQTEVGELLLLLEEAYKYMESNKIK